MLWVCTACTCSYSVGAPGCPECGATDHREEGNTMPKITVHGGPSHKWDIPAAPEVEVEATPSPGNSSSTSAVTPQPKPETPEPAPRRPAGKTANPSRATTGGRSTAGSADGSTTGN